MKLGFTVKNRMFISAPTKFIIVSNYETTNEVYNWGLITDTERSIQDVGRWIVKYKNIENERDF